MMNCSESALLYHRLKKLYRRQWDAPRRGRGVCQVTHVENKTGDRCKFTDGIANRVHLAIDVGKLLYQMWDFSETVRASFRQGH